MSSLHKKFSHSLARIGTYLEGQTGHDKTTNVKANCRKDTLKLSLESKPITLKVIRNTERFGVLENVIKDKTASKRQ